MSQYLWLPLTAFYHLQWKQKTLMGNQLNETDGYMYIRSGALKRAYFKNNFGKLYGD